MTLDKTYANRPWPQALNNILEGHIADLNPLLVVRGDDPPKVSALRDYYQSRKDVLSMRLGYVNSMPFIGMELLTHLDPVFAEQKLKPKGMPHETIILRLRELVWNLPYNPIIVLDNCQHLHFDLLFRVLRMINELEGKALFVFLLPEYYAEQWDQSSNPRLKFFLKFVHHHYALEE